MGRQCLSLGHDRVDRARALITAQVGHDAEGAAVVAALGHLQIGDCLAGGAVTGQVLISHEGGASAHLVDSFACLNPFQHAHDVLVVASPHDCLGFGQALQQLLLEVLGQATGNDQFLAQLSKLYECAYRLFARFLDEAAGVHHHDAGVGLIGAHPVAGLGQQAKHVLGVHAIFFAAQVGKSHGGLGYRGVGFLGHSFARAEIHHTLHAGGVLMPRFAPATIRPAWAPTRDLIPPQPAP